MILQHEADVTRAVLAEVARTPDLRLREILTLAVEHLHAFVREARLTEAEFQQVCHCIARAGQATHASHNEVVLAAGSLGVSTLVCLRNNPWTAGTEPTTANLLGPFWRDDSPVMAQGDSIVRSSTPGEPVFVTARVVDRDGRALEGARVDVWHASSEGFYENQDPTQADMNLRGRFTTDAQGCVRFRSIKPTGYPIPVQGPVGDLLRAQGRHNMRPAHIHFLIAKPGYKTQFAQVYSCDDSNLQSDVQFGVTEALIGQYIRREDPSPAADVQGPWYTLDHRFILEPGQMGMPRAPISGKATGPRHRLDVLKRR